MKTSRMEQIMDEADAYCSTCSERLPHAQVFAHARAIVLAELNRADALCENDSRHYSCSQSQKILKERRGARRVLNTLGY